MACLWLCSRCGSRNFFAGVNFNNIHDSVNENEIGVPRSPDPHFFTVAGQTSLIIANKRYSIIYMYTTECYHSTTKL